MDNILPAFPLSDLPPRAIAFDADSKTWCPNGFVNDLSMFDGKWKLEREISDSTRPIMQILGHSRIAMNVMDRAAPVSDFHFDEDRALFRTITHLPYRNQVKGVFDLSGNSSSVHDSANNIHWYDVRSSWDVERSVMYSVRKSNKGTMYDVRRVCTDASGNDYMYFIMGFLRPGNSHLTRVDRWLKRIGF